MCISGHSQSLFMSAPAFYLTGVLEKIRMALYLTIAKQVRHICSVTIYVLFRIFFSFYFSIEIHTWLREAFNFFTFIFIFWNLTAFFWEIMEAIRFVLPNLKLRSDILIVGPIHLWFLCDPAATSIDLQWWSEVRARVIWKKNPMQQIQTNIYMVPDEPRCLTG